mmetsp:Transcript_6825/g.12471  ORF Transcript_6825/g.12471 Transcript_6825/m.12471 type:complete len:414 (+) Transcript_6825:1048-2289(+)
MFWEHIVEGCGFAFHALLELISYAFQRLGILCGHLYQCIVEILCCRTEEWVGTPAFLHDVHHLWWAGVWDGWSLVDPRTAYLWQHLPWVFSFKRGLASIDLIEDHSKRVNVTSGSVLTLSSKILRSHVEWSTLQNGIDLVGSSHLEMRETKVSNFGTEARVNKNVLGLEISMKNGWLGCVQELDTLGDITDNLENDISSCTHSLVVHEIIQATVLHVFHHKHGINCWCNNGSHDGSDTRVTESREKAHFDDEVLLQPRMLVELKPKRAHSVHHASMRAVTFSPRTTSVIRSRRRLEELQDIIRLMHVQEILPIRIGRSLKDHAITTGFHNTLLNVARVFAELDLTGSRSIFSLCRFLLRLRLFLLGFCLFFRFLWIELDRSVLLDFKRARERTRVQATSTAQFRRTITNLCRW